MAESSQVTLNGPHCVGVEYDMSMATVAAGSEKRIRPRDNA